MSEIAPHSSSTRPHPVSIAIAAYAANLVAVSAYALHDYPAIDVSQTFEVALIGLLLAEFLVEAALLWLVANGFRWARNVLAALAVLVNAGYLLLTDETITLKNQSVETYLAWLSTLIVLVAIAMLFSTSANTWFKQQTLWRKSAT